MVKKAQIEIIGLVIIVLLVLVGLFLMLTLGKNKPKDTATGYNEKLINSFVSTLPDVEIHNTECGFRPQVKDLIRAWHSSSSLCDNPKDVLETKLKTLMENSLSKWGYHYEFSIKIDERNEITINHPEVEGGNPCVGKPKSVRAEQPVPLTAGGSNAFIRLRLCYD